MLKSIIQTFRLKCRDYASRQVDGQRKDFIRLGVLGDWQNPYLTMNFKTEADIVRSLAKVLDNGHLVRGLKPVLMVSSAGRRWLRLKLNIKIKMKFSIDVAFAVVAEDKLLQAVPGLAGDAPVSVVIWTTTPWTLPANQAVCLHPELEYLLVECELHGRQQRLILAEALHETALDRFKIDDFTIVGRCLGAALEGLVLQHPFYDKQVPLIMGDHVTTETGTGCVHTAPDHGVDDFLVGKKNDLGTLNLREVILASVRKYATICWPACL